MSGFRPRRSDSAPPGHARRRLHDVQRRPQHGHQRDRDAELIRAQNQERVGRVAEREQEHRREERPERPSERHASKRRAARLAARPTTAPRAASHERRATSTITESSPGIAASRKTVRSGRCSHCSSANAIERADDGAGMIRRAMKAERATADRRVDGLGDQCVARRAANSLPYAIREANGEHLRRRLRERDERARQRRERIARDHERLPPAHAIRPPSARELQQRGRRFRGALRSRRRPTRWRRAPS